MEEPRDVVRLPQHWFSLDTAILEDPEVKATKGKAFWVFSTLAYMAAETGRRDRTPPPHLIDVDALIARVRVQGRMSVATVRTNLDLLHRRGWIVILPRLAGKPEMVRLAHEGPHS